MSEKPLALVTCGPAYEPIDAVRCITNHSSGELGAFLCDALAEADYNVICLRGNLATYPAPAQARVVSFSTNASLLTAMQQLSPDAIFHAAALCDFLISEVSGADKAEKIRSDAPGLTLTLSPAPKILPQLRVLFPHALIVGWKYELDGSPEQALERGRRQIAICQTDACVVNGAAYGSGFGFLEADTELPTPFPDKPALALHLAQWTREKITR